VVGGKHPSKHLPVHGGIPATLTQPTTKASITLIDSVEKQTYLPEHTLIIWEGRDGNKDQKRSATSEMKAICK